MRTFVLVAFAMMLSACTTSLEKQAGSAAKGDCRQQAEAYIRANMASIANEWREHEKYKHYQKCLSERANTAS
jgi:outer membrane PBP1 activator LpoA protein